MHLLKKEEYDKRKDTNAVILYFDLWSQKITVTSTLGNLFLALKFCVLKNQNHICIAEKQEIW